MSFCALCKTRSPEAEPESWTAPTGEVMQIAHTVEPCAVADTSVGELEICAACYHRGLPAFFSPEDLAEIHYEFGLEYLRRKQFGRSKESLLQARQILESADIIAALAYVEDALGHAEPAVAYYRHALELDPSHFMSQENLKNLQRHTA